VPNVGQPRTDFQFFMPADAQNVRRESRQNVFETAYTVAIPYPAARFICELDNAVARDGWRGLPRRLPESWSADEPRAWMERLHQRGQEA
jgi:hypothetical protein